jgi:hypothetical protein
MEYGILGTVEVRVDGQPVGPGRGASSTPGGTTLRTIAGSIRTPA